jgi:hypothetical protein
MTSITVLQFTIILGCTESPLSRDGELGLLALSCGAVSDTPMDCQALSAPG